MSETKHEMPSAGGSYIRQPDGSLQLEERTEPIAGRGPLSRPSAEAEGHPLPQGERAGARRKKEQ